MKRRVIHLHQVLVVPALTTLGLASLLMARDLPLSEPVSAAPGIAPASAAEAAPSAAPPATAGNGGAGLSAVNEAALASPEFGGGGTAPNVLHATRMRDLVRKAREVSGREDPFVPLTMPDAEKVVPLATLESVKPAAPAGLIVPAAPRKPAAVRSPVMMAALDTSGRPVSNLVIDPPEAGDEPARGPVVVPRWSLAGVLNTGREQVALLEADGMSREAKLGEVLEDGARVVKIESGRVVLMLNGRRFPRLLGTTDGTR